MIRFIFCMFAFVSFAMAASPQKLTIKSGKANHRFLVEIADDDAKREKGLMFRESMDADKGMLFIFRFESVQGFWMKNTLIPLDMIFIGRGGRIIKIHPMAKPHDEKLISSGQPVVAVLEINGGEAKKRGLKVGDEVIYSLSTK